MSLFVGLGCRSLSFRKPPVDGSALQGHVIKNIYLNMGIELSGDCRILCSMENTCVSINIGPPEQNGVRLCQLSDSDHKRHPEDLKLREGFLYWATKVSYYIRWHFEVWFDFSLINF